MLLKMGGLPPHKVADALGLSWADCAAQFIALREQGNGYAGLLAA